MGLSGSKFLFRQRSWSYGEWREVQQIRIYLAWVKKYHFSPHYFIHVEWSRAYRQLVSETILGEAERWLSNKWKMEPTKRFFWNQSCHGINPGRQDIDKVIVQKKLNNDLIKNSSALQKWKDSNCPRPVDASWRNSLEKNHQGC